MHKSIIPYSALMVLGVCLNIFEYMYSTYKYHWYVINIRTFVSTKNLCLQTVHRWINERQYFSIV